MNEPSYPSPRAACLVLSLVVAFTELMIYQGMSGAEVAGVLTATAGILAVLTRPRA